VFKRAHAHRGASFVEVFQNCIVYNDGVFDEFTAKPVAADRQIAVEHGKPLIFGAEKDKGLRINPTKIELEVVTIGENDVSESDILVHDETSKVLATLLAQMEAPLFPVAIGVLYCDPAETYETAVHAQVEAEMKAHPTPNVDDLLRSVQTWTVE
jgi:2-oxoglutarate ferredoxin oxidoreductase subunit beta